ncbi:PadR family transcriptional regulator [Thermotoga sp. KOL6]|uniref:PadR family transcriptional regulator n=1 Tax=Thermotoga sp. KOL6 TaxID=126741 RepID=UPI000C7848B2|nr:PadR family transcriptional regulator [Thermotoga sp. KOL6]PLV60066.1 PadR family transcriptional regulator [Thermotoga sp. KOL6]
MKEFKGYLKLIVLHILSKRPSHGYSIMKEISQMLGSEPPSPGALYPVLASLRRQKLILLRSEGKKKIYSLTEKGREFLEKHSDEYKEALELAKKLREFSEIGGKELKDVAKLIFENLSSLNSSQKEKLQNALRELKKTVQRIIYGGE